MKFDELDAKMRVFETAHDLCVLPQGKRIQSSKKSRNT